MTEARYIPDWCIIRYQGQLGTYTSKGPANTPTVHFSEDKATEIKSDTELEIVLYPAELAFHYLANVA